MDANERVPSPTDEAAERDFYQTVASINIILFCDNCRASLDPDHDLGEGVSFESDNWSVRLGDLAYDRGWKINWSTGGEGSILCPECAAKSTESKRA